MGTLHGVRATSCAGSVEAPGLAKRQRNAKTSAGTESVRD
jgi:hypothetical protein